MLAALRRPLAHVLRLAAALALAGCAAPDETEPGPAPEPTEVAFPATFSWGAATAGFQIETGLADTDWGVWAATPGKIQNGDLPDAGPDAFAHVAEDVAALLAAGLDGYRFSIEMARVYPTRAAFDADAPDPAGLAAYDGLLAALDAGGIRPMVTLHHFVWPRYMSDPALAASPQGWERDDAPAVFGAWCRRMAARYGDRVDLWVTINEPNVEAMIGYVAGYFPPGVSDPDRLADVLRRQVSAHAACYDAIHDDDATDADGDGASALVSVASHNRLYEPADPTSAADLAAVAHSRNFWNLWLLDAVVRGDVDLDFDDVVDVTADPGLVGRADYIGLNYYGTSRINAAALKLPYVGVVPAQFDLPNERPKNDLGWDIYPPGFGVVLDEVARYGLPVYITENGIADALDVNRSRFTAEHLFEVGKAIARGIDVRGYYHWSIIDNFEWASGFCPRFGLFQVDFTDPARPRSPTSAVPMLAELATSGRLTKSAIAALPPYQSKPSPCAGF